MQGDGGDGGWSLVPLSFDQHRPHGGRKVKRRLTVKAEAGEDLGERTLTKNRTREAKRCNGRT